MNKTEIHPIGIGTWKVNCANLNDIEMLTKSYNLGQNYLSLYMMYENGNVVRYLKSFIENFQLHSTKFIDISLSDTYKEMKRLKDISKTKYLGISNCTLEELKTLNENVKIDFFEGVYNLECKIYEKNKTLEYCKENGITFIAYQPLRRNRTALRNYDVLIELSKKYNKTQNQILLNWMIKEKGIMCLVKSTNENRINENIESLNFEMDKADYNKLNQFESEEFNNVKIDWNHTGDGVSIDQLANQFE